MQDEWLADVSKELEIVNELKIDLGEADTPA